MMPSDLEAWEEKHGKIPDDVILLVFFDWGKHYADKKKYLGTDTKNASLLHFPGTVEGVRGLSLSYCYSYHRRPKLTIREIDRINYLCKRMNDLCKRMSDLCKRFEWDVTT